MGDFYPIIMKNKRVQFLHIAEMSRLSVELSIIPPSVHIRSQIKRSTNKVAQLNSQSLNNLNKESHFLSVVQHPAY